MRLCLLFLALFTAMPAPSFAQRPSSAQTGAKQSPLPPLRNPPGDISDNQVFVEYRSTLGFTVKAPEGWSRREQPAGVSFTDKYGSLAIDVTDAPVAPTAASAKQVQAAILEALPEAVTVSKIATAQLPGGPAVAIVYASNSAPNPVTGKAIRLENEQYLFWRAGKLATLTLSAPLGADNTDQWQLMARSFRWN